MALTPEPLPRDNTVMDFRAPPPSPVASGRRSSVRNEEVLSDFLRNSLQVPDLILPDSRAFPRQISIENPPKVDMGSLNSLQNEMMSMNLIERISQTGCFEVINHGIPDDLIKAVLDGVDRMIFEISSEKRKQLTRSLERPFGFEEFSGEEETETSEEFVWCRDQRLKMDMEGIWPLAYSKFSDKMESLVVAMEDVAAKVVLFLHQNSLPQAYNGCNDYEAANGEFGSLCYLYKHYRIISADKKLNSLRYDAIRMLIGGSMFPHALSLHACNGSDGFNIYSKKGWASFQPTKGCLFICIGDKLQVPEYPSKLFFFCEVEPVTGGETPIVLSHAVYERMKDKYPEFVEKLEKLGLIYTRVLGEDDDPSSPIGRGWKSTFLTTDRTIAEERAANLGVKLEWTDLGVKSIMGPIPAVKYDPTRKRKIWFNSMVAAYTGWKDSRNDPVKAVTFGDGSPLQADIIHDCHKILEEESIAFPWKQGDVLLIDNLAVLHSRKPFIEPRRVLASLCK